MFFKIFFESIGTFLFDSKQGVFREASEAPLQDACHERDGGAVVGKWYTLIHGTFHPVLNIPFGYHASAAMDDD